MKFLGFDISFAYDCIKDIYFLMKSVKKLQDKKKKKVGPDQEVVQEEVKENEFDSE